MYVFFKVSIHVQQTTQLKHNAAYNTEEGETTDWQQTAEERENEQQRKEKMNGRGMRKWIGTAGMAAQEQEAEKAIKLLETNIYSSI